MSGGSLDYVYRKVEEAADHIDRWNKTEKNPLHRKFSKRVREFSNALQCLEWVLSCDYAPGDEVDAIQKVLDRFVDDEAPYMPSGECNLKTLKDRRLFPAWNLIGGKPRCTGCVYFDRDIVSSVESKDTGVCTRFPPVAMYQDGRAACPRVVSGNYCGEFKDRRVDAGQDGRASFGSFSKSLDVMREKEAGLPECPPGKWRSTMDNPPHFYAGHVNGENKYLIRGNCNKLNISEWYNYGGSDARFYNKERGINIALNSAEMSKMASEWMRIPE